ncbi:MAG: hypothetical protein HN558_20105, partial [Gemmatimonadetes bacterium]|nr:hypothetical protein [Gemmatimonadota bacterium]
IPPQMEAWEKYATATTALGRQVKGIAGKNDFTGDKAALAKVIKEVRDAHRSLPGGRKRLDKQIKDFAKAWQSFLEGSLKGKLDEYKGESFVFLKRMGSEREEGRDPPIAAQRIKVGPGGSYSAIVRPNSYYEAWMLEPTRLIIGSVCFVSPRNGGNKQVPPIPLCADDGPDTDSDYLSDRGERIVGTNKDQPDTDGDSVPDGFEILNGTDPSGGNPVFTGILATAPASGGFSDFVTTEDDLAILGNGPAGIDLFDIGSGVRPIKISSIDTPGSVRKAALAGNYIAVADGSAGLTVVDLTSRESPSVSWKIPLGSPANAIATAGNVAFVGLENGKIVSYDLFSGQEIDALHLGGTIEDLTTGENLLFALENVGSQRSRIHSIPTRNGRFSDDDGPFLPRNSADTPGFRQWGLGNGLGRRLFVGDDFAYVTDLMGFNRVDLSDPTVPVRAERTKTRSRGWRHTVANGSGLAVAVEHQNSPAFAQADPSLYTVQKNGDFLRDGTPRYMENFETRFPTPGNAGSVSIYNGLAYVADGNNGLQVVNYRAYDIKGNKPSLQVSTNDTNGTVEEASLLTIRAFVEDDIQVKNVDFFVDDERVYVDGSYPFGHVVRIPLRQDQESIRLKVIARDTGGNEAVWPAEGEFVLNIADDLIPPEVVTYLPREGETIFGGDVAVVIFNEGMDPDTINADSVSLVRVHDDNNTTPVTLAAVTYDDASFSAYATLPSEIGPGKYRLSVNGNAADLAGNNLKTPAPVRNLFGPAEIRGNFWFDRNHDTIKGSSEEHLEQWTVYLDQNNNGSHDAGEPVTKAGPDGSYAFTNLRPGGYAVAELMPYGWVQTYPRQQNFGQEDKFTNTGWTREGDSDDLIWEEMAPISVGRNAYDGVETLNGKIYFVGGSDGTGSKNLAERYDPATNQWEILNPMMTERTGIACATLDGKLYAIGGQDLDSVEIFDPGTGAWSLGTALPSEVNHGCAISVNGKILLVGGRNSSDQSLNQVLEFNPSTNQWTAKASMPTARWAHKLVLFKDRLWAIGGHLAHASAIVESYDPLSNTWRTETSLTTRRDFPVTWVTAERIFVAAGYDGNSISNTIENYELVSNQWTGEGYLPQAKFVADSASLNDKVYIVAGNTPNFTDKVFAADVRGPHSVFAVDSLGNGWSAGIVADGNFTVGPQKFDGNGTAGLLYLAKVAPTGQVDKVVVLGNPDANRTGLPSNLMLKADHDGGVWLAGAFTGNGLAIDGQTLEANGTASFAARFGQDLNATAIATLHGAGIDAVSPDRDGNLGIAGT